MRPRAIYLAIAMLVSSLALRGVMCALAGENLLHNSGLDQGLGKQPSNWINQRLRKTAGTFTRVDRPGLPGELQVMNRSFDLAQWSQSLTLEPGWYRLGGEVETRVVRKGDAVALLGVSQDQSASGWSSDGVSGRSTGEFYFRVTKDTRRVEIVCSLTGVGSALFRNLQLTKIADPPPPRAAQIDLGVLWARHRQQEMEVHAKPFNKATGSIWTEVALMAALTAICAWSWRTLA